MQEVLPSTVSCYVSSFWTHLTFQLSLLKRAHWSTKSCWQAFLGYVTPFISHKKDIWKGNNPFKHHFSGGTAVSFGGSMFHQPEIMFDFFGGAIAVDFCLPVSTFMQWKHSRPNSLHWSVFQKFQKGTRQSFKKNTPTTLHYPVIFSASPWNKNSLKKPKQTTLANYIGELTPTIWTMKIILVVEP